MIRYIFIDIMSKKNHRIMKKELNFLLLFYPLIKLYFLYQKLWKKLILFLILTYK